MRDWAVETALAATKANSAGTLLTLALVAGHWSNTDRIARPGTRRIAEMSRCSTSTASSRLSALVASGDLAVEQVGAGHRATRYRVPALDDAVERGGLAFASEGTLRPLAFAPGPNGRDMRHDSGTLAFASGQNARGEDAESLAFGSTPVAFGSTPVAFGSTPVAFGQRSPLDRTEVRSNEVTKSRARASERETGSTSSPAEGGDSADPSPTVEQIAAALGARFAGGADVGLHHADDEERARTAATIAEARRKLDRP